MNPLKPINIIIAGVGGQGVVTLTQILTQIFEEKGILVQGSIHKGGAQQLGSIHSVLRLFAGSQDDARNYSTQILDGDLDLILGLEPWETLRYRQYFSPQTKVVSNSRIIPIETERYQKQKFKNPCDQLKDLKVDLRLEDFSTAAEERFDTGKMVNYIVAERAVIDKLMPLTKDDLTGAFKQRGLFKDEKIQINSKEELNV
jgi:Pyruvate/2-oxoacid:ferredoxin oxidoreductase gamma subunit